MNSSGKQTGSEWNWCGFARVYCMPWERWTCGKTGGNFLGELRHCFVGNIESAKALQRDGCGMLAIWGKLPVVWDWKVDCKWGKHTSKE